jgi:hypothetical protein
MSQTTIGQSEQNLPRGHYDRDGATSVFVPSAGSRTRVWRRWCWIALSVLVVHAVVGTVIMVAWPQFKGHHLDSAERAARLFLEALVREDSETVRRLGTIEEPPAIRSVRNVARDPARDQVLRGSFAPLGKFHARIDADYAYDAGADRYTPKNPLGAAAETLDALHAAKEAADKSQLSDKIASGSPEDQFDAAEQLAKVFTSLAAGALSPKRIVPTYKMLVESAQPSLAQDAKALALEVAGASKSWETLLKRRFQTLKADGPFIYERAVVNATVADRLSSLGEPPSLLRLELVRFRLEGIDTGWKVVAARRVLPGEAEPNTGPGPAATPRVSKSASHTADGPSGPFGAALEPR